MVTQREIREMKYKRVILVEEKTDDGLFRMYYFEQKPSSVFICVRKGKLVRIMEIKFAEHYAPIIIEALEKYINEVKKIEKC